jgi:hypothetical protein
VRAADRQAGHDFGIAVVLAGVLQQAGNHQRPVIIIKPCILFFWSSSGKP